MGLIRQDTEAIVNAWGAFGKAGLGDLAGAPPEQWADILDHQVHEEAKTSHGAFFGALLTVRQGSDLQNHARLMLERLAQWKIPSGGTLRDAIAFIAAMHAEDLGFLSRPVLARALGCAADKLHRTVIAPLGTEAAATTTSSFIFTRHRRIAQALVSVLETDFAEDIAGLFVKLATAAIDSFVGSDYVPDLAAWRFRFARHFYDTGRQDLALRIAEAVLRSEPDNGRSIGALSCLYRDVGRPDRAVQLFRETPVYARWDRGCYFEWSVCEGDAGDHVSSVLLATLSSSDGVGVTRVSNDQAKMSLAGLGVAFGELFAAHREVVFRDARAAVAILGLQLHCDATAVGYFQKHLREATADGAKAPSVCDAFDAFHRGVVATEKIGVHEDVAAVVPDAARLEFEGLRRLVEASIEAKERRVGS